MYASCRLSKDGKPPSDNEIQTALEQCVADAVGGSFGHYPPHLAHQLRLRGALLSDEVIAESATAKLVQFSFKIPAEMFPVHAGGLQLMVNLLSGDLFPSEAHGVRWTETQVKKVELPKPMEATARELFRRDGAHDIAAIRGQFRLAPGRPLLAYSHKPRVGSTFEETRETTLDVLKAGFNIAELDSRDLAARSAALKQWMELGIEAAQTGRHSTAFSPNLSLPAGQAAEAADAWVAGIHQYGPPVIKIDGGLDGLSSLQAIRSALQFERAPLITCYPMLRKILAPAIGADTWVTLLALSGADIIYPGGRPTFTSETRPVWPAELDGSVKAVRYYDQLSKRGWPMPTIAGGFHPGLLHVCYELFGPNVAYFLGGAVALHPQGPRQGAELCLELLDAAIEAVDRAQAAGDDHSMDLPKRLVEAFERTTYPGADLDYVSPANFFGKAQSRHQPRPYYRRAQ